MQTITKYKDFKYFGNDFLEFCRKIIFDNFIEKF